MDSELEEQIKTARLLVELFSQRVTAGGFLWDNEKEAYKDALELLHVHIHEKHPL